MRRSHRHIYVVTAAVMLIVAAAPFYAGARLRSTARDSAATELETVLTLSHEAIGAWADQHLSTVALWGESLEIRALLGHLARPVTQISAQQQVSRLLRPALSAPDYQGFFLLDATGMTVASSIPNAIGTSDILATEPDLFALAIGGSTTLTTTTAAPYLLRTSTGELQTDLPTILVAAPVTDPGEDPSGVLVFAIDPRGSFTTIAMRGRIGGSGETYVFNSDGTMVTASRFEDQLRAIGLVAPDESSALTLRLADPGVNLLEEPAALEDPTGLPLTRMAAAAITGTDGMDLDGYRDYRGAEVVGAWIWDYDLSLGVATEVDVTQAYGGLSSSLRSFFGAAVAFELMLAAMAGLLVRKRRQLLTSQRELREANEALENRVQELTRSRAALQETERRLNALVQSKDEFIASVSHELRTPLTALVGFAQMLQEDIDGLSSTERDEMLSTLVRGGVELSLIVEDLLTAAKAAQGELTVESVPVELGVLATEVTEMFGKTNGKDVLLAPYETWASGDANRIRQIARNLISNAIRYGGNRIEVSTRRTGSEAVLTVTDNGDGIPDDDAERMFDPYQHAENARGVAGSMGLGLTISRRLARLMDGDLKYARDNGTTVFLLALPATEPEAPSAHDERAKSEMDAGTTLSQV